MNSNVQTHPFSYKKEDSFSKLVEIQTMALALEPKPDFGSALRAEELKGKLFSLYTDKKDELKETSLLKLTPTALVSFVERGGYDD